MKSLPSPTLTPALIRGLTVLILLLPAWTLASAATETIEIRFLPLQEAAAAAKSQLSEHGRLAALPSRRLLLIDDDETHIQKVRSLLQRLDVAAPQYRAELHMSSISNEQVRHFTARAGASLGRLQGGWMQLTADDRSLKSSGSRTFRLRLCASEPASIETGVIRPSRRQTILWLSGHGLLTANNVDMIPVTSGFYMQAWPAGPDAVRVRITPWMQRQQPGLSGRQELLMDLGKVQSPATPPDNQGNMRLNASPGRPAADAIEIDAAGTEITIPLDQEITIAAVDAEAKSLGNALLASQSGIGEQHLVMRLRISRQ